MPELWGIVPRPANVAKGRRCAEGPSVKTMLAARASPLILDVPNRVPDCLDTFCDIIGY